MGRYKNIVAVSIILIVCFIGIAVSNPTHGGDRKYEIEPEITLPEYQNDLGRVISAYERMMDRLMYMTERNFNSISFDVKDVSNKLVSIDSKLTELSARIAKIEKALGIEQSETPGKKNDEVKNDANDNSIKQPKP